MKREPAHIGRVGQSTTVLCDGIAVVTLTGEVDIGEVDRMREVLLARIGARHEGVVLDLAVGFLGSVGVAALVEADDRARREGVGFAIVAAGRAVRRPLEITGLLETLPVHDSVDEALHALRRTGSA